MTSYLRKNTEILICSDKIDIDQLGIGRIKMKKERSPHYFYAISIPRNIQLIIKQKCLEIEANYPFKDWVHERDYHITLAFLGSAPSEVLDEMNRLLVNDLKNISSFNLYLEGVQTFGLKERPRILWCDIHKEKQLHEIQAIVTQVCEKYGFPRDRRNFTPHITLAKKWQGENQFTHLPSIMETPLSFEATEVGLYEVNTEEKPKYKRIATFSLKS